MDVSKDAYYFSHDANARNDLKNKALRKNYGWEGYGWFWMIVEIMREEDNYKLSLNDFVVDALADEMGCETKKAKQFIQDCIGKFQLFESDKNCFWSPSLLRRMEQKEKSIEQRREAGRRSAEARKQSTNNQRSLNGRSTIKGKERKGNKRKEISTLSVNKTPDETIRIFDKWIEQKIIIHKSLTNDMKKAAAKTLKTFSIDEILEAISNYGIVQNSSDYFFDYCWTLEEFLIGGGKDRIAFGNLKKFLTESKPLDNYRMNSNGKGDTPDWMKVEYEQS